MTTPRLGAPELTSGQATPETTVNEQIRYIESGAGHFIFKDRDLATPPGSPADGDCYLVAASPTGAWAGQAGKIAFRVNTAWAFITAIEGFTAWVNDENVFIGYDGAAWNTLSAPSGTYLAVSNNLSDLASAPTARTNLGVPYGAASDFWTGTATAKVLAPDQLWAAAATVALTDGATITPDFGAGVNFSVTLGGSRTLANPTNAKTGQSGVIVLTQDATGSRVLTYGTKYKFPGGAATGGVLSTAASSVDVIAYYVRSNGDLLCTLSKAFS